MAVEEELLETLFERAQYLLRTAYGLTRRGAQISNQQRVRSLLEEIRDIQRHDPVIDRQMQSEADPRERHRVLEQQLQQRVDQLRNEVRTMQAEVDRARQELGDEARDDLDRDGIPDDIENRRDLDRDGRDDAVEERDRVDRENEQLDDRDGDGVDDAVEDRERAQADRDREAARERDDERRRAERDQETGPEVGPAVAAGEAMVAAEALDEQRDQQAEQDAPAQGADGQDSQGTDGQEVDSPDQERRDGQDLGDQQPAVDQQQTAENQLADDRLQPTGQQSEQQAQQQTDDPNRQPELNGDGPSRQPGLNGDEASRQPELDGDNPSRQPGLDGDEASRQSGLNGDSPTRQPGLDGDEVGRQQGDDGTNVRPWDVERDGPETQADAGQEWDGTVYQTGENGPALHVQGNESGQQGPQFEPGSGENSAEPGHIDRVERQTLTIDQQGVQGANSNGTAPTRHAEDPVLDGERAARADRMSQTGQQPGRNTRPMSTDEQRSQQHLTAAGISSPTGATNRETGTTVTTGERPGTPAQQHGQNITRGGRGQDGPGIER